MILTLRTDKPESEVGLFAPNGEQLAYKTWEAHRRLSETLMSTVEQLLENQGATFGDVTGIVFYEGPGSFTGLRIGASFANALRYSLGVPGVNAKGDSWQQEGAAQVSKGVDQALLPFYGNDVHVTAPKK